MSDDDKKVVSIFPNTKVADVETETSPEIIKLVEDFLALVKGKKIEAIGYVALADDGNGTSVFHFDGLNGIPLLGMVNWLDYRIKRKVDGHDDA